MSKNSMTGCLAKLKVVSETKNHNISTEEESPSNGTSITLNITMMITLHPKLSKDINSISSTQNCLISKKLHSIIWKPQIVLTIV